MRKYGHTFSVALGGISAALAVVIMSLGGMIPFSTFICPMLSILILSFVLRKTGNRIALAWYGAVSILSLLLSPDKEAASMFLFLGYYPILKPIMEKTRIRWLLKAILFNTAILLMYYVLIHIVGLEQVVQEQEEMGVVMTIATLLLGNITFFLLDRLLDKLHRKWKI